MLSPGELVRRSGLGDGDGVVRIVDAMRLHSRSMDILDSGCNAIWCLAKAEPGLKGQIRRTDAVQVNARLANSCTPRGLTAALKGLTAARRTPHCQQL